MEKIIQTIVVDLAQQKQALFNERILEKDSLKKKDNLLTTRRATLVPELSKKLVIFLIWYSNIFLMPICIYDKMILLDS